MVPGNLISKNIHRLETKLGSPISSLSVPKTASWVWSSSKASETGLKIWPGPWPNKLPTKQVISPKGRWDMRSMEKYHLWWDVAEWIWSSYQTDRTVTSDWESKEDLCRQDGNFSMSEAATWGELEKRLALPFTNQVFFLGSHGIGRRMLKMEKGPFGYGLNLAERIPLKN